jgi:hypothetical protein
VRSVQVPEAEVELPAFEQGFKALSESGGTPGGTLRQDQHLKAVVDAWPWLNERDRSTILKIIQASHGRPPDG